MTLFSPPQSAKTDGALRILLIDDDRELCALIKDYLEPLGYAVTATHDGRDGVERALAEKFHAVILDVMLPGLAGFEVLKRLRQNSEVPILMLTSRGEETDRVVGLEMGADDYLPKTFSSRELLARLRAVTRRKTRFTPDADDEPEIVVGPLRINSNGRVVLLARSSLISGGGLIFDPNPWLALGLGILEQRATEVQSPYVHSAAEKAEQMAMLVAELLTFSKATLGASAVRLEPTGLRAAALEAIRRETTEDADLQLEASEELLVAADPELLTRAIANLLRNAQRHAGSAGPITVRLSGTAGEATLSVADCGPGVPETELTKIFDAFYRVDTSRMRETGGSGLGLAIVKACVDSCLGTVSARNRVPQGLDVRIQFPIYTREKPVANPAP